MEYILKIYKDGTFYKEIKLHNVSGIYMYKWLGAETGAYSFSITEKNEHFEKEYNITYNHTSPFASEFRAYGDTKVRPKYITGIQDGTDISVEFNPNDNIFILKKRKFTRIILDIEERFGVKSANLLEISGHFNDWTPRSDSITKLDDKTFEIILDVENGYYEYKYLIDHVWYPREKNQVLVVGEIGKLFPKGELRTGKFSYKPLDSVNSDNSVTAIMHNPRKLRYFNKITEREFEFTIRTQLSDVERVYIYVRCMSSGVGHVGQIYELERIMDQTNSFDYFKRIITFNGNVDKLEYYFILEDGGYKKYYGKKGLEDEITSKFVFDKYDEKSAGVFHIPYWSREAIWYNIFPDRFYNGDTYNDPIFNEFGPERFKKNKNHESKFIKDYKWNQNEDAMIFERNRWTSDFAEKKQWEKQIEKNVDYSVKYARMYGGDLRGIKEKIPYLKELGITAVWLNPVFFSYQNHKYGSNDFRHISPDFGTIRTSGKLYDIYIDPKNKYGNKSYVDVLGLEALNNTELELLEVNLVGKNKGKNGYLETEDPSTWVWTESDLIMVDLIKELHKNGIRVIFDGVFNHSSTHNFAFNLAMAEGPNSKYAKWYKFHDFSRFTEITEDMSQEEAYRILSTNKKNVKYTGWAGFDTLPEFDSYNEEWKDYIFNITRKWMLGPDGVESTNWQEDDGIDGWRLDVPNCLNNQMFWHEWRQVVKGCKNDSYITAELWNNAGDDINSGEKFDAVMNYEWLKVVIGYFINQGKNYDERYKLTAEQFLLELREKRNWYPLQALQACQNLNGSHDTDRLYSRIINDGLGRNLEEGKQYEKGYNNIRPDLAANCHPNTSLDWINMDIKPKDILKLISVFQMTYIGAPMIYYGDEVGMWGATDPYCRKPMLWDEFWYDKERNNSFINRGEVYEQQADKDIFSWYKKLIKIRKEHKCLIYGRIVPLMFDNEKDIIVYERYNNEESIVVVLNNSFENHYNVSCTLHHRHCSLIDLLTGKKIKTDKNGRMTFDIKAKKAYIFYFKKNVE